MAVLVVSYGLVSRISDAAAAILGVTNLYLIIGFSLTECLAQSGSIILAQYLGAKRDIETQQAYVITIWLNLFLGLILTILFVGYSPVLLSTFGFPSDLLSQASHYLTLVGSGFGVYALNYALLYILNANGLTKYSMAYSFLVNGMSLSLYYFIGLLPIYFAWNRLTLIGMTNFFSRICGMIFLFIITKQTIPHLCFFKKIPWRIVRFHTSNFLRIGIPNIFEPLSYQLFQLVLVKIISTISFESLSIRSYIISLTTFFETAIWSISKGNQIILGHFVGAEKTEFAKKQLRKGIAVSFLVSIIMVFFGLAFRKQIMHFFSKDPLIIEAGIQLLTFVAFLTLIRVFSLNLYAGLKAAGDVRFGFILTSIGMWCLVIPGSYVLTRFFGVGLNGIWAMIIVDELIRVFFFSQRWKSQKWQKFSVTENRNAF